MMSFPVDAGERTYDVVIGPLADARSRLRELARGRTLPVVSDARVWALHGGKLQSLVPVEPILVPEGEAAKCWEQLQRLIREFTHRNLDRSHPVVALGGGSIGDLAGLATALFKRGCPVVHVPTTLLAQVDSAVGGKTAIDAEGQKNLVGTFHHPALVLADVALLDTLDERQLRAGYAEVVKYALIGHEVLFDWLERHGSAVLSGNRAMREEAVQQCLSAKARLVEADPEDRLGVRALLNLGHTFGHAIESAAGLGEVLHGEAVAIGCTLAFNYSASEGICPQDDARRVRAHLAAAGLPTTLRDVGVSGPELVPLMHADKKNEEGRLRLVLARGIGDAYLAADVSPERLADFLARAD